MSKFQWTTKKVSITVGGVVAALLVLPNLSNGLVGLAKIIRTTEVAYAAKDTADAVDEKFNQYLVQQQAYTQALNAYVAQQQQQSVPNAAYTAPEIREWDGATNAFWCCPLSDRTTCWDRQLWRRC